MNRQRGQSSVDERKLMIHHFNEGKTLREIGNITNRPHTTVQNVIKRYKETSQIENKYRKSPNKIFTESDERWIIRKVQADPKISAPKLANKVEKYLHKSVSPQTIRNVLKKNGLNGRVARKKPFVSKINRKKRLDYVKTHLNKNFDFWKQVLFTDESKYNIFGSDGRVNVWRKANQELAPKNLRPTVKHGGGSVLVWGCMSASGVGNLHFIDGIMDQNMYIDILKKNLKDSATKLGIERSFHFYQDNDPKHKAHKVRNWLLYNCPHVMETPPQSPDLNVIENLWSQLEIGIRKHSISNKTELKTALLEEWNKINAEDCEKLVRSIPNRLQDVKNNKGYPTKY